MVILLIYNFIIFNNYSHINKRYPIFADKMACLLLIMSSNNLHNKQGPYYVLYQYLIKRTVLSNILQILPDAVDFYHWIHEEFSDRLTRAEVDPATVQQLLETNSCCNVGLSDDIRGQRFRQFLKLCSKCCIALYLCSLIITVIIIIQARLKHFKRLVLDYFLIFLLLQRQ